MSESGRRDDGRRLWPAVCVDVETLDIRPTARILEIGVVCFDPQTGETGPLFAIEVSREGQEGRSVDEETQEWWAARQAEGVVMPGVGYTLAAAAECMGGFLAQHTDAEAVQVWAWGMDFDFPILANAFWGHRFWRYYNQRCARTLCAELGIKREGKVAHRALADAIQEAEAVMKALAKVEAVDFLAHSFFPDAGEGCFGKLLDFAKETDEVLARLAGEGDGAGGIAAEADFKAGGAGAGDGDGGDVRGVDPCLPGEAGAGVDLAAVADEEEAREFHGLLRMMRDFAQCDAALFRCSLADYCGGKRERMEAIRRVAGRRMRIDANGVSLVVKGGEIICEDA